MKTVGIFEAKTHLPALCERVATTRSPVVISRRGRPLVVIHPLRETLPGGRADIHTAWRDWKKQNKETPRDFPEVWKMRGRSKSDPLAE